MSVPYPSSGVPIKLKSPLMKGENVKKVQSQLEKKGYSVGRTGIDGKYGKNTLAAVKKFQSANSLTVDGIVGPKTWAKLFEDVVETTPDYENNQESPIVGADSPIISDDLGGFDYDDIPANLDSQYTSYIINLASRKWVPLPVIPEQISESISTIWGDHNIIGRSASYKSYQGTTNRQVNITLKLHSDLLTEVSKNNNCDLTNIVDFLKSLCYPQYTENELRPPVCILKLADVIKLRGITNSINAQHSLPIKKMIYGGYKGEKRYAMMEVQLSFTEVPIQAPSATEILANKDFSQK